MSSVHSENLSGVSNADNNNPSGGEPGSTSPVPGNPGGETAEESVLANDAATATATRATPLTAATTKTPTKAGSGTQASTGPPSAVEFEPPVACVRRILKQTLPSSSNVGKDAVAAFARASGIFIIYLTACANDFARENRRQTITANDVLAAIKELEFDEFAPELTTFLERYRELEKNKKDAKAASKAAAEKAKELSNDDDENENDASKEDAVSSTPENGAKKSGVDKESFKHEEEEESTTAEQHNDGDGDGGDVSMDPEEDDEDEANGGNINNDTAISTGNDNDNDNGEDGETDKADDDGAMEE